MMHGCEIITLTRIVENDAKRVSVSRPDTAHAVSQIHTVHAIVAVDRAITNREYNAVSLSKRHNHRSGLHTRPLFRHNKFTAGKIFRAFRQQDCELKREHMVAVQVLVQTVVIVWPVPEQKWCRFDLAGMMASLYEVFMIFRVTNVNFHRLVPTVSDRNKTRIEGLPKAGNQIRQGIAEILVFPTPEVMTFHHDPCAENVVLLVQAG
jgi:hypothetical protein